MKAPGDMRAGGHTLGVVLTLGSAASFSLAGLFVRLIETAGPWQIIFYRCTSLCLAVVLFVVVRYGRHSLFHVRSLGWKAPFGGILMGSAMIVVIFAFLNTTVANVVFIGGALPFVVGVLAWLFLAERIDRATLIAMTLAFAGIALMMAEGLGGGRMMGDLFAVSALFVFGGLVVILRAGKAGDMTPILAMGAGFAALVAAVMVPDFRISRHDLVICLLMGSVQTFLSYVLMTYATRLLRAAELTIIGSIEFPIAPLWVWIAVAEVPSNASLIGGVLVFGAVCGQALWIAARTPRLAGTLAEANAKSRG
ncbi:MAG: DMT family transporter [Proteobacteria bacterium]|nr:DMT family transporter [Pseudomonadota bacterium]